MREGGRGGREGGREVKEGGREGGREGGEGGREGERRGGRGRQTKREAILNVNTALCAEGIDSLIL